MHEVMVKDAMEKRITSANCREQITQKDAAHVLYKFTQGQEGLQPGGFTDALLEAMSRADGSNIERLLAGFSGLGYAVLNAQLASDGMAFLRGRFAGKK